MRFDHLIYASPDLDRAGAEMFSEHGLGSRPGGRHPGHGTANSIVPLSGDYIELIGIVDDVESSGSVFGSWIASHSTRGDGLASWAVRTDDIDGFARRVGLPAVPMERELPGGERLAWRLVGMGQAISEPPLPIVLQWDAPDEMLPWSMPVEHKTVARGIAWVELAGDEGRVREWLGDADLDVRFVEGSPGIRRAAIATDAGEVVLRSATAH